MKVLLDTHALFWWLIDAPDLPVTARKEIIHAETVLVSAASMWEIATKVRLGKWPEMEALLPDSEQWIIRSGFTLLSISWVHAQLAGAMNIAHRDPFDRMLIAQSRIENASLISNETLFDQFGIVRVWS